MAMSQEAQLEEARLQNEQLAKELVNVSNSSKNVLKTSLMVQGLLSRFRSRSVRSAFLNGKFGVRLSLCSADVLESLDILAGIMLPSPRVTQGDPDNASSSMNFVSRLLVISDEEPRVKGEVLPHRMTYLGWRSLLNDLMVSTYWDSGGHEGYNSDGSSMSATVMDTKPGRLNMPSVCGGVTGHPAPATEQQGGSGCVPLGVNPNSGGVTGGLSAPSARVSASVLSRQPAVGQSCGYESSNMAQPSRSGLLFNTANNALPPLPGPTGLIRDVQGGQPPYFTIAPTAKGAATGIDSPPGCGPSNQVELYRTRQPIMDPIRSVPYEVHWQHGGNSSTGIASSNTNINQQPLMGDSCLPSRVHVSGARVKYGSASAVASTAAVMSGGVAATSMGDRAFRPAVRGYSQVDGNCQAPSHLANFQPPGNPYAEMPTSRNFNSSYRGDAHEADRFCPPLATSDRCRTSQAAGAPGVQPFAHVECRSSDDEDDPYVFGGVPNIPRSGTEQNNAELSRAAQLLGGLRLGREVVPPPKFDGRQGTSLSSFFRSYECYFESKYEGGDRERALKLKDFLSGQMLRVYEMNGGPSTKYTVLRERMMEMFRAIRTSTKEKAYEDFNTAFMKPGDSVLLHCMHLEHLAEIAFPDSQKERDRQKMRRLRETAPASFLEEVHRLGNTMAQLGQGKPRWENIKVLAGSDEQGSWRPEGRESSASNSLVPHGIFQNYQAQASRDNRTAVPVAAATAAPRSSAPLPEASVAGNCEAIDRLERRNPTSALGSNRFARSNSPMRGGSPGNPTDRGGATGKANSWVRRSPGGDRKGSHEPARLCNWCGEPGHTASTCYERRGLCKSCGKSHQTHTCSQIRDTDRKLECPSCGGDHLGRNCTKEATPLN